MSTVIVPPKPEQSDGSVPPLSTRNQQKAQVMGLPSATALVVVR